MDTILKLGPVWHFLSQAGCYAGSQSFTLRVGHYLFIQFLKIPFLLHELNLSALPSFCHFLGTSNVLVGESD